MYPRARPSPYRSRRGNGAGTLRTGLILVAAALPAIAVGGAHPRTDPGGPGTRLLTVSRPEHGAAGSPTGPPRLSILRSGEKHAMERLLTGDFYSASSPSVSFDGRRFLFGGRRRPAEKPRIWEMGTDGSGASPVTPGLGDPGEPAYLPDGRILFTDHSAPGGSGAIPARSLYSCAPDGSGIRRLTFGEAIDSSPRVLPDGRVRFERRLLRAGTDPLVRLLTIHPDGTGLALFTGAPGETPGPIPAGGGAAAGLDSGAIARRPLPPVLTSVVHAADRTWRTGTLLGLNVYSSRIPEIASLPPGSVDRVRISRAGPAPDRGRPAAGEAPVHPDGSFYVEVPADTLLRLTLLAKDGRSLASLDSGIWVRPGENRGCIGCHEPSDLAPENVAPVAVRQPPVSLFRVLSGDGGSGAR